MNDNLYDEINSIFERSYNAKRERDNYSQPVGDDVYDVPYNERKSYADYHPDGYMDSLLDCEPPEDTRACLSPYDEPDSYEKPVGDDVYDVPYNERDSNEKPVGDDVHDVPHNEPDSYIQPDDDREQQAAPLQNGSRLSAPDCDAYYSQAYKPEELIPDDPDCFDENGEPIEELDVMSADELMHQFFPRRKFIVDTLLTPGLAVLAGAPKIGKSWMVLDLCMKVASGKPFLGCATKRSDVLYLALEDDRYRLHKRLLTIADEAPDGMKVAHRCSGRSLEQQIRIYVRRNPDVRLIVIDTFQKIRKAVKEMSYANDYKEVSRLKEIADELGICILLVHHTRKLSDSDYMNEISGTNGIAGSADTLMVLKKEKRNSRDAVLSCTGRDVEDRELTLKLDRDTCIWQVISDSLEEPEDEIPEEIPELIEFMKSIGSFSGSNSDFTALFCDTRSFIINPSQLKKSMNLYRDELLRHGVEFISHRSNGKRTLCVTYFPDSDAQ